MNTRAALGVAAALNLLAAVAVSLGHSALAAADALTVMSTYRELDVNGVIDHARLSAYDGGRLASDPWAVPDYLNQNRRSVFPLAFATSAGFVANAAVFLLLWRKTVKPA